MKRKIPKWCSSQASHVIAKKLAIGYEANIEGMILKLLYTHKMNYYWPLTTINVEECLFYSVNWKENLTVQKYE